MNTTDKIVGYGMVATDDIVKLTKQVSDLIKEGSQPYGNLLAFPVNSKWQFFQPMVTYQPLNTEEHGKNS